MTNPKPTNVAASVRGRLMNLSRESGEDFQLLLTRYGTERLLYRISRSEYADQFVLKGAVLFQLWTGVPHRPTRDLDLLGKGDPGIDTYEKLFIDICEIKVDDDGLYFDPSSVRVDKIKEENEHQGVRIKLDAKLQNARIRLQVDVGFGDAINPPPVSITYPALLEFPTATLLSYPRETVVAEKFQAMVSLGIANSRMKDFFDIWTLTKQFLFVGDDLRNAIQATFDRRKTKIPIEIPIALTGEFANDSSKQLQWTAFLKRTGIKTDALSLSDITEELRHFLVPLLDSFDNASVPSEWPPGGPWAS